MYKGSPAHYSPASILLVQSLSIKRKDPHISIWHFFFKYTFFFLHKSFHFHSFFFFPFSYCYLCILFIINTKANCFYLILIITGKKKKVLSLYNIVFYCLGYGSLYLMHKQKVYLNFVDGSGAKLVQFHSIRMQCIWYRIEQNRLFWLICYYCIIYK